MKTDALNALKFRPKSNLNVRLLLFNMHGPLTEELLLSTFFFYLSLSCFRSNSLSSVFSGTLTAKRNEMKIMQREREKEDILDKIKIGPEKKNIKGTHSILDMQGTHMALFKLNRLLKAHKGT